MLRTSRASLVNGVTTPTGSPRSEALEKFARYVPSSSDHSRIALDPLHGIDGTVDIASLPLASTFHILFTENHMRRAVTMPQRSQDLLETDD